MTGDPLLDLVHMLVRVIELVGIAAIVLGAVIAFFRFGRESWPGAPGDRGVDGLRSDLGTAILLGLEFLVAADIINTVAVEPTLQSVAVLAGIVAIRTFLSFSLEVEIQGKWPWKKAR